MTGYEYEAVIKSLLANDDVNPNCKDYYGRTPMWWAKSRAKTPIWVEEINLKRWSNYFSQEQMLIHILRIAPIKFQNRKQLRMSTQLKVLHYLAENHHQSYIL